MRLVVRLVWFFIVFSLGFPLSLEAGSIEEDISNRLQNYVAERLSVDVSEIEIAHIGPMNGRLQLLPGKVTKVRPSNASHLLGRVVFFLTMQQAKRKPVVQRVNAEVARVLKVVVAKHRLQRHQVVGRDDLEMQTVRIRRKHQRFETDPGVLIGKRMVRSLKKGDAVRLHFVEDAPVILRGEQVTISLEFRGLTITSLGKAAEDGLRGEMIKVVNLDSKKVLFGEVVGQGRVRIGNGFQAQE